MWSNFCSSTSATSHLISYHLISPAYCIRIGKTPSISMSSIENQLELRGYTCVCFGVTIMAKKCFMNLMVMVGSARNNYNEQKAELEFSMLSYRKKESTNANKYTTEKCVNVHANMNIFKHTYMYSNYLPLQFFNLKITTTTTKTHTQT